MRSRAGILTCFSDLDSDLIIMNKTPYWMALHELTKASEPWHTIIVAKKMWIAFMIDAGITLAFVLFL